MKILIVSLFLPMEKSYHAGGRYVFELLKALSQRHEIHLATRVERHEASGLQELEPLCCTIYPYFYNYARKRDTLDLDRFRRLYGYIGFSHYADRLIREGDFDLVQVEWVPTALAIGKHKVPMVLDAHDVITKPAERAMERARGAARLLLWLKYLLVKGVERRITRKFDTVFTVSEFDKSYLLGMQPGLNVKAVPIPAGMDLTDRIYDRKINAILFLASYTYRKANVEAVLYFYHQVFPLVKRCIPDVQFIIAGAGPPEELTSIPARDPQIVVTGFVDDTDRYYKEAAVFVAPILIGGGIIVKILDAMAAGTPVVTTSYGNEVVGAVPGRDILVTDDPASFAAAVVKTLTDKSFAERLGASGRAFVQKHYSREAVFARLDAAYAELGKRSEE